MSQIRSLMFIFFFWATSSRPEFLEGSCLTDTIIYFFTYFGVTRRYSASSNSTTELKADAASYTH